MDDKLLMVLGNVPQLATALGLPSRRLGELTIGVGILQMAVTEPGFNARSSPPEPPPQCAPMT